MAASTAIESFKELSNILSSNKTKIIEYDIIPVPTMVFEEPGYLGLPVGSIKSWYSLAYSRLFKEHTLPTEFDTMSRICLMIQPDVSTLWNRRKKEIVLGKLHLQEEFTFTALVMKKHPKRIETFNQRRWVLSRLFPNKAPWSAIVQTSPWLSLDNELALCTKAAEGYPSNYNAWSHRQWIISHFLYSACWEEICEQDLKETRKFCGQHISDHSGLQHVQFLIKCLGNRETRCKETLKELETVKSLSKLCPGHAALWSHRRWAIHSLQLEIKMGGDNSLNNNIMKSIQSVLNSELDLDALSADEAERTFETQHIDWLGKFAILN